MRQPVEETGSGIPRWNRKETILVKRTAVLLFIVAGIAAWCAGGIKLLVNWKNPNYAGGTFKNVMVLGLNGKAEGRADFEDALVAAIARPGTMASTSYEFLPRPDATPINMADLRELVKEQKFDAIVVARLVKATSQMVYVPGQVYSPYPYYGTFYGYYAALYPVIYTPGYMKNEKKAQVEVNLYSITKGEGELVWTGTTDTVEVSSVKKTIKELVKSIIQEWEKQGILEPQSK